MGDRENLAKHAVNDALTYRSYYFTVERKNYRFSLRENLNKRFADKRAPLTPQPVGCIFGRETHFTHPRFIGAHVYVATP